MGSVRDIQGKFTRAILENSPEIIAPEIVPDGLTAEERYNIYRNNTYITLGQALAQNFPVLCRLVGQRFFDHLAREYVGKFPPATPLLMSYGDRMAAFLDDFSPVSHLPYLSDVARLEYCWNLSFNGPDAGEFDLNRLNKVPPERFDDLVFALLPNMKFMTSIYPVLDIWLANQPGTKSAGDINLESGGCFLITFRRAQEVEIMSLDTADYHFLNKIQAGNSLGVVTEEMLGKYPDFDLQTALQRMMQGGLITGFEISTTTKEEK